MALATTLLNNPAIQVILTFIIIVIFVLFCRMAKSFTLPSIVKKLIMLLTIVAAILFNAMYSIGNSVITASGDYSMATKAVIGSIIWVFIFAFALMSETRKPVPVDDEEDDEDEE